MTRCTLPTHSAECHAATDGRRCVCGSWCVNNGLSTLQSKLVFLADTNALANVYALSVVVVLLLMTTLVIGGVLSQPVIGFALIPFFFVGMHVMGTLAVKHLMDVIYHLHNEVCVAETHPKTRKTATSWHCMAV